MPNVVFFNSYKLKKGMSTADFLLAAETLNKEYISKQQGYILSEIAVDGETWADFTTFETMDDLNRFLEKSKNPDELAKKFYSFINLMSCRSHCFSVERSYSTSN